MSDDYSSGHDGRKKRRYKNKYKRGGKFRSTDITSSEKKDKKKKKKK